MVKRLLHGLGEKGWWGRWRHAERLKAQVVK